MLTYNEHNEKQLFSGQRPPTDIELYLHTILHSLLEYLNDILLVPSVGSRLTAIFNSRWHFRALIVDINFPVCLGTVVMHTCSSLCL